ncbi:MAG TPA: IS66 family transposase [Ktedonobacterales bacterium]|jgi:transposase
MSPEERAYVARLEAENVALREQVAALLARVQQVEGQRAKDSHNSSKPPSSDGLARKTRSLRQPSGKKPGGQSGHRGTTLRLVAAPDHVVRQRPAVCACCQAPLEGVAAERVERRQVQDLPPVRLVVTEHQAERVRCPQCHALSPAAFPAGVEAPAQYGPRVRALAVYLSQQQVLPFARVRAVLAEVVGCPLSVGTVVSLVQRCAAALAPVEAATKTALQAVAVLRNDESPVRVGGRWQWVHVSSTERLTHYGLQAQRGATATEAIGILPGFRGTSVHDGWTSYWHYRDCRHALCNVHLLRELTWVAEQLKQPWAAAMKALLLDMRTAVATARAAGATQLEAGQRAALLARYAALLAQGVAANPVSPPAPGPPKRGRRKQSPARNLLDRLFRHQHEVLAFLDDFAVPFDNNLAERDLRMLKVQQKIAGCFRSVPGAVAFCRTRGVLSTLAKQGIAHLATLQALFADGSLPQLVTT